MSDKDEQSSLDLFSLLNNPESTKLGMDMLSKRVATEGLSAITNALIFGNRINDFSSRVALFTLFTVNPDAIKLGYSEILKLLGIQPDNSDESIDSDDIKSSILTANTLRIEKTAFKLYSTIPDPELKEICSKLKPSTLNAFSPIKKAPKLLDHISEFVKAGNFNSRDAIAFVKSLPDDIKSKASQNHASKKIKEPAKKESNLSSNSGTNSDSNGNTAPILQAASIDDVLGTKQTPPPTPPPTIDLEDSNIEIDSGNGSKSKTEGETNIEPEDGKDEDDAGNGDKTEQITKVDIDIITSAIVGMGIDDLITVLAACQSNIIGIRDSIDEENRSTYPWITSLNSGIKSIKHKDEKGNLSGVVYKLIKFKAEVEKHPDMIKK